MTNDEIIIKTAEFIKNKLTGEGSGHDWWHIDRVWKNARSIAQGEKADMLVVELAALLHDIADWKFNNGDEEIGARLAKEWLESIATPQAVADHVYEIIATSSFKGAGVKNKIKTLEGKILQDADRLDAIGAIGIARCFAYGGNKNRPMYDPNIKPEFHTTAEAYKAGIGTTVNHFYEKLLLLKDQMHTETAKKIAIERHAFMEQFLERFFKETEGKA